MKKLLSFVLTCFLLGSASAATGDTTIVRSHNRVHMNYYGSWDSWVQFPPSSKKSERIWLKYTLSCPDGQACSGWDYTTQVYLRKHTGKNDSTLKQAPSFTVDGAEKATLSCSYQRTFTYQYNATKKSTDTVANPSMRVINFKNTSKPLQPTDTVYVYKAAYFNYVFDSLGVKKDSIFVKADTTFTETKTPYYQVFEVVDPFELMRVITPYASDKTQSWNYEYWADVTDFSSLLHDSAEIRAFYSGYSDGFAITLDFIFIEGTPAREAYRIDNFWNASYAYGNPNNPINTSIQKKTVAMDSLSASSKLRFTVTGHGSDQGDNCSEFCPKMMFVKIDSVQVASQLIWNDKCGENPIYPQTGTWIYDRANWCPGSMVSPYTYELNPLRNGKTMFGLDVDFQDYTAVSPSSTSYTIAGQVVYYKNNVYQREAAIEEILSPNNGLAYVRQNPSCNNAQFTIKNLGTDSIWFVDFEYQIETQAVQTYTWYPKHHLGFNEVATVNMPYLNFAGAKKNAKFRVSIVKVNGQADALAQNNTKTSTFNIPVQTPLQIVVETATNNVPQDNYLLITNTEGKELVSHGFKVANTVYRDTLTLGYGCYNLVLADSSGDGLDFWASRSQTGSGSIRIMKLNPYGLVLNGNADFGSTFRLNLMAGAPLGIKETALNEQVDLYPNPTSGLCHVKFGDQLQGFKIIELSDIQGRMLTKQGGFDQEFGFNTSDLQAGVYLVLIQTEGRQLSKRLIVQ